MEFRAKSKETKGWVFGPGVFVGPYEVTMVPDKCAYQTKEEQHSYIFNSFGAKEEVVTDTIGRCTEYTDNNHVKIYEGDIVNIKYRNSDITYKGGVVKFGEYKLSRYDEFPRYLGYYIVVDKLVAPFIPLIDVGEVMLDNKISLSLLDVIYNGEVKVIGNVFDNPTLLELNDE